MQNPLTLKVSQCFCSKLHNEIKEQLNTLFFESIYIKVTVVFYT